MLNHDRSIRMTRTVGVGLLVAALAGPGFASVASAQAVNPDKVKFEMKTRISTLVWKEVNSGRPWPQAVENWAQNAHGRSDPTSPTNCAPIEVVGWLLKLIMAESKAPNDGTPCAVGNIVYQEMGGSTACNDCTAPAKVPVYPDNPAEISNLLNWVHACIDGMNPNWNQFDIASNVEADLVATRNPKSKTADGQPIPLGGDHSPPILVGFIASVVRDPINLRNVPGGDGVASSAGDLGSKIITANSPTRSAK